MYDFTSGESNKHLGPWCLLKFVFLGIDFYCILHKYWSVTDRRSRSFTTDSLSCTGLAIVVTLVNKCQGLPTHLRGSSHCWFRKGRLGTFQIFFFFFFFGLSLNFSLLLLQTFLSEHLFHCLRKAGSCEGEFCCVSCRWGAEMPCAGGSRLAEATFSRMPAPAPGGSSRPTSGPVPPAWGFCLSTWGRDYACWANVWEVFWSSQKEKERLPTCDTLC